MRESCMSRSVTGVERSTPLLDPAIPAGRNSDEGHRACNRTMAAPKTRSLSSFRDRGRFTRPVDRGQQGTRPCRGPRKSGRRRTIRSEEGPTGTDVVHDPCAHGEQPAASALSLARPPMCLRRRSAMGHGGHALFIDRVYAGDTLGGCRCLDHAHAIPDELTCV